ncbi:MAG: class I SAM-dependent methyltransferase [Anaerolineales bacterium]
MPEVVINCPLCDHDISHAFDTRQFRGHTIYNRVCACCGFVFQSPRMETNELDAFYASEYRQVYQGEAGPNPQDLLNQEERASALLNFAKDTISNITRHLDIGCSAGCLLEVFRDHYQSETVGVEPGDAYRRYAQSKGLIIYPDIADIKNANESKFDLISMAHVLEHLPDPVGYLISLREQYLLPQGWLLIEVPNLYCHDSFEIAHLASYSMHTLCQTLLRSGFEIFKHQSHGRPRSELLGLYLTVLAKPGVQVDVISPEKMVAQKRQLGMLRRRVLQKLFPKQAWIR